MHEKIFHYLVIIISIICLTLIVISGHGDDPIVAQIISGAIGGSSVVLGGSILRSKKNEDSN